MAYTQQFFAFQLTFADRLIAKFPIGLPDALYHYTTFSKTLGMDGWNEYLAELAHASDPSAWTYQWYLARRPPDPTPSDTTYYDHPLFGCFYYIVRDTTIIRPHFIKNDLPSMRPLSQQRQMVRQDELRRMFTHIREHVPTAHTVLGNSWMYNLEAYRRLYPPAYTSHLPVSDEAEFQFLAFWGQCFDYRWNPKPEVAQHILDRLATITTLTELRWCFPYQILQPQAPIEAFFTFYGIE